MTAPGEEPEPLVMWVVHDRPRDYPNEYVARKWLVGLSTIATSEVVTGPTLASVRAQLPPNLVMMPRATLDDPHIVEVWL